MDRRGARYMRKTPNFVSGTGAFSVAEKASARTRRVSEGRMMPSSQSRAVAWSEELQRYKDEIVEDRILLFEGTVEWRDGVGEPDLVVKRVMTVEQARKELTRGLVLRLAYAEDEASHRKIDGIAAALKRARGHCPVFVSVKDPAGKSAQFKLNGDFTVDPVKVPVEELEMILGKGQVIFTR